MPADRGQRGGNNRLVERPEEHRQHDAEDDGPDFRMRERRRLGWRLGLHRSRLGLRFRSSHRGVYKGDEQQPAHALMIPVKQDAPARGWYVQHTPQDLPSRMHEEHEASVADPTPSLRCAGPRHHTGSRSRQVAAGLCLSARRRFQHRAGHPLRVERQFHRPSPARLRRRRMHVAPRGGRSAQSARRPISRANT